METQDLALVSAEDLSLAGINNLNEKQLALILKKTPKQYVHTRPAKGGGQWEYVTGGYVKKCLNLLFGWDWDFEILDDKIQFGEAIVKGKLTCRSNGKTIIKTQYGNKDIIFKKEPDKDGNRIPLSIGNDLKAAATDALKKCAAEIGIAADIYNKMDFKEVNVQVDAITLDDLRTLLDLKRDALSVVELKEANRIINGNETKSFSKLQKLINSK
jgi:recombination DNA repair RAD52 pathway protein